VRKIRTKVYGKNAVAAACGIRPSIDAFSADHHANPFWMRSEAPIFRRKFICQGVSSQRCEYPIDIFTTILIRICPDGLLKFTKID